MLNPFAFWLVPFFLLWNSLMTYMNITQVYAPLSRGEGCNAKRTLLMVFPRSYIGFIVPWFGGLLCGLIGIGVPYGVGLCISRKYMLWGGQKEN